MRTDYLNSEAIDLVRTYQKISEKYGQKKFGNQKSCLHIIQLAESVIGTNFDWVALKGVHVCLTYEVKRIAWQNSIWGIPTSKSKIFSYYDRQVPLITSSIILTIVAYRNQLNERETNLSHVYINMIITGLEWMCYLIKEGATIDSKIEEIEFLDVEKTKGWIEPSSKH